MSKINTRRMWFLALALALLAFIPISIIKTSQQASNEAPQKANKPRVQLPSASSPTLRTANRAHQKSPPTHQARDLKKFHHSQQIFRNVSLEEAFGILLDDYYAICEASGETPIRFKLSVEGNSKTIPYLKTQGNFHTTCRLLALRSGTRFEIKEDQISFTELSGDEITTRLFTVPPTFTSSLSASLYALHGDPFLKDISASDILRHVGLLNDGEEMTHSLGEGRIKVTGSGKAQWVINELAEITRQEIPLQTRLKFTDLDQESPSPSVILRPESHGSIPLAILQSGRSETYHQALALTVSPHGFGEKIDLYFKAEEDPFGGFLISPETLSDQSYFIGPGDSPEERTVEIQIPDSSGELQQRTLTLQRIDATGRAVPTIHTTPE